MENSNVDILLAEDTASDAEMTIRALKKGKVIHQVVHVWDGKEAFDFLMGKGEFAGRDTSKKPKVILMDLKMPRVTGLELLRLIKQEPSTRNIPVVVLTSSKEDPDMVECYALGVNSYIIKPVGLDAFTTVVSELGLYWMMHNQLPSET